MERNRDIHVQYPPREVSMTLNVMSALRGDRIGQFVFDENASRAVAVPENFSARFIGLIELLLATDHAVLVPDMIQGIQGGLDSWMYVQVQSLLGVIESQGDRDLASFWRDECASKLPQVIV